MKVWITKYALTHKIEEKEAERCSDINNDMIEILNSRYEYYHDEGKDWHTDKESAIKKAEEMKQKKIKSLKRQIEKLENMKFE